MGGKRGEGEGGVGAEEVVLGLVDFVGGVSPGVEEGEGEVRQGLGQAILLSSLRDNASFWATLRPNASLSMLHTVGVFLRKEQNAALKEDLLSCFSVSFKASSSLSLSLFQSLTHTHTLTTNTKVKLFPHDSQYSGTSFREKTTPLPSGS